MQTSRSQTLSHQRSRPSHPPERLVHSARPSVLVVDQEPQMRRFIRACLESGGYRVMQASTAADGLRYTEVDSPDVVLVDLDLPDVDGFEFTRRVRRASSVPILVLSKRTDELSTVRALDGGADDYLTKPFGAAALGARIRLALRHATRTAEAPSGTFAVGSHISIDLVKHVVRVNGDEVRLTPIEYKLLATLARDADKVLSHQHLLEAIWGPEHTQQVEYLRVYMNTLRSKLEEDPATPRYLVTELGVGYRLRLS